MCSKFEEYCRSQTNYKRRTSKQRQLASCRAITTMKRTTKKAKPQENSQNGSINNIRSKKSEDTTHGNQQKDVAYSSSRGANFAPHSGKQPCKKPYCIYCEGHVGHKTRDCPKKKNIMRMLEIEKKKQEKPREVNHDMTGYSPQQSVQQPSVQSL